ncbi:hypothetical protein E0Z10_g2255 [Xylaria hypoxylon]|uniref:NWD NACHT-NTPase N-terminal domain-containing protein n=1 Tax=Xylaria hypoxylon TaxID=37992 RepID=A0A4Z0Z6P8_9PEZI|nr:hypothetical protein E0Z10_g2255 [Xylaria hypoxylon]
MSTPSSVVTDLWAVARSRLAPEHQSQLSLSAMDDGSRSPLQALLLLVQEKQKMSMEKRWRLRNGSGKVVFIRDLFEKIAHWINKFKEVGDTIVTYDPTHAALPWAGIRFLLHLAISDIEIFGSIVEGVETSSRLITRCGFYETVYLAPIIAQTTESTGLLKENIVELYVEILIYLAKAAKYYQGGTGKRIVQSLAISSTKFQTQLKAILQKETELQSILRLVESERIVGISNMVSSMNISSVENKDSLGAMKKIMESLEQPLTRVVGHLAHFEERMEQQEWLKVSQWLSNVSFREQHELIFRELLPGTGEWLLDRSEYQQWQYSSSSSVLWIRGIQGCGSKLCSLVVQRHLSGVQNADINAAPVAYFYCFKTHDRSLSSPTTILCGILKQLAHSRTGDGFHHKVFTEYERRKQGADRDGVDISSLTLEECGDLIVSAASDYPIQIFLDGVDEMDDSRELLEVLNRIVEDASNVVKVFISSRDEADVAFWLHDVTSVIITSSDNSKDISKFITRSVDAAIEKKRLLKGKVAPELKQHIISKLSNGAGSMFLWVSLHLTQLCDRNKYKLEKDVLYALESLPVDLKRTFDRIYQNINEYPHRFETQLDEGVILDLCSSFLEHNPNSQYFAFAHASILEYFQSLPEYSCSAINYMAAHRCLIQLVQYDDNLDPFSEFNSTAANSFMSDESDRASPMINISYKGGQPSFRRYAVCYWARHYGIITEQDNISRLDETLMEFVFNNEGSTFEIWLDELRELVDGSLINSVTLTKELAASDSASKSPIFVASVYGILPIFERLTAISKEVDWNAKNTRGASAIYITARFGQPEATKYLLQKGTDVNSQGGEFGNPAQTAAFHGHTAVLELLDHHGSDLIANGRFPNSFHAALMGNQDTTMKLLLEGPSAKDIPDMDDLLSRAAYYGHYEIVELLLLRKEELRKSAASPISSAMEASTTDQPESYFPHDTLQAALYSGRPGSGVAMRLLKRIGDVNNEGGHFGNALQAACAGGYLLSVRWLLEHGADVNSTGRYGSALKAACLGGHDDVVSLLLDAGARSESLQRGTFDAFEAAASRNRLSTLTLLLNHFPQATNNPSNVTLKLRKRMIHPLEPALKSACLRGHIDVVRCLLANGAEKSTVQTLDEALISGQEDVIEMLLRMLEDVPNSIRNFLYAVSASGNVMALEKLFFHYGVDPNLPVRPGDCDQHFGSAIHVAAVMEHVEVVKSLIKRGADVSAQQTCCRHFKGEINVTPIQAALQWGHESSKWDRCWEVCELLIEAGAGEDDCRSVLKAACEHGKILLARRLIDRGTRLSEMPVTPSLDIVKLMVEHDTAINSPIGRAFELQQQATKMASCDLLEYLIRETGLLLSVRQLIEENGSNWYRKENIKPVGERLLDHGDNIDGIKEVTEEQDTPTQPPLLFALASSNWELVEFLISHGADVNRGVISPLTFAYWTRTRKAEFVELLESRGAVARPMGQVDIIALHTELRNAMPWLRYEYRNECRFGGTDHY